MTLPRMGSVWAFYALQNSMMFTPCGPRAVPTGGAGVAAPAWSCTLTSAAILFLGGIPCSSSRGHDEDIVRPLPPCLLWMVSGVAPCARRSPRSWGASDLLDLVEAQLDRGLPAEDLDEGLDPLRLCVDLGDRGVQRGERAVHHHDRVRYVEVGDLDLLLGCRAPAARRRCRSLGLRCDGRSQHALHLVEAQRHGLVAVPDEAGHR